MKKIFFIAASALMFASCTEDFKDWAEDQTDYSVPVIDEVTLTLTPGFESLDLDVPTESTVKLFTPTIGTGFVSVYDVTLSADGKTYDLKADYDGSVYVEDLNAAVIALYNRERVMRDIEVLAQGVVKVLSAAGDLYIPVRATTATKVMVQSTSYSEFFYEIGGETGWSTVHPLWGENFDGKYVGYAYLDSEFKFKPNADNWDNDLEFDGEGKIADNGGSNCPAPAEAGLHRIEIDLEAMTYAITNFGGVSIIGDAVGDPNWGTDIDMEYSSAENCYITTTELVAGSFKFRTDHAWNGVNWGGDDPEKLEIDKGNCSIAEGGLYIIRFWPSYSGNGRYEIEAL